MRATDLSLKRLQRLQRPPRLQRPQRPQRPPRLQHLQRLQCRSARCAYSPCCAACGTALAPDAIVAVANGAAVVPGAIVGVARDIPGGMHWCSMCSSSRQAVSPWCLAPASARPAAPHHVAAACGTPLVPDATVGIADVSQWCLMSS